MAFSLWKKGNRQTETRKARTKADASGAVDKTIISLNDFKRQKRRSAAAAQREERKTKIGRLYTAVTTDFYSTKEFGPVLRAPWVSFFTFTIGLFAWSFLHDDVQQIYGGQVWFWTWVGYLLISAYLSPRLWHDVDLAMMALVAVIFLPCLFFMALWVPAIVFVLVSVASLILSPVLGRIQ